ncbi:MAG: hypothetical protein PHY58_07815 [Bacteroidales bacterium]|nr:hypothetical protein [Bacteroidales bacterium]
MSNQESNLISGIFSTDNISKDNDSARVGCTFRLLNVGDIITTQTNFRQMGRAPTPPRFGYSGGSVPK